MAAECTSALHPDIQRDPDSPENGLTGIWWSLIEGSAKFCTWRGTTPRTRAELETKWLKKSLAKKEQGVLLDDKLNESAKNVSIYFRLHQESIPSRSGKVIILLYSALVKAYLKCCIQFWAQQYKKNVDLEGVQGRAMKKIKGLKNWPCWISWDCSSGRRLGGEETYLMF